MQHDNPDDQLSEEVKTPKEEGVPPPSLKNRAVEVPV
jgi:hypothetical protein